MNRHFILYLQFLVISMNCTAYATVVTVFDEGRPASAASVKVMTADNEARVLKDGRTDQQGKLDVGTLPANEPQLKVQAARQEKQNTIDIFPENGAYRADVQVYLQGEPRQTAQRRPRGSYGWIEGAWHWYAEDGRNYRYGADGRWYEVDLRMYGPRAMYNQRAPMPVQRYVWPSPCWSW